MAKTKVAILGSGNIGSDLLVKISRSKILECSLFIGQNTLSEGLRRAQMMGVKTSAMSIQAIEQDPKCCDIVIDATSAQAHQKHAPILKKLNKFVIDMTPSQIGKMCVPAINLQECLDGKTDNINMITCGGQAMIPIIRTIMDLHPETEYVETVSSIASKSAGIGTRDNIDEFTQTTGESIKILGRAPKSKAIIILNPADPPIMMHNTIYAVINKPKIEILKKEIGKVASKIREYVPGFKLILGPLWEKGQTNRVIIMVSVVGQGDYLPKYAGNLDIINCAAIAVAEAYTKKRL
jgi:acetaldehyde dehydrogenase